MKRSQDWDPGELCGWSTASGARPPGTESPALLARQAQQFPHLENGVRTISQYVPHRVVVGNKQMNLK